MICLLDINVLLALAWADHPQHDTAHDWVAAQAKYGSVHVATCPLTEKTVGERAGAGQHWKVTDREPPIWKSQRRGSVGVAR